MPSEASIHGARNTGPTYDEDLLTAMQALAERHGLRRVEVQLPVEEIAPDGRTPLQGLHSILFLPGLGWTAKDDLRTQSWGQARIIGRHRGRAATPVVEGGPSHG